MVARVLIQGGTRSVIKASLPGFDVNTANLDQLAFSGIGNTLFVYRFGSIGMAVTQVSGPNQAGNVQVDFGEVPPQRPLCFFNFRNVSQAFANGPQAYKSPGSEHYMTAEIHPSAVQFRFRSPGATTGLTYEIRYLLLMPV